MCKKKEIGIKKWFCKMFAQKIEFEAFALLGNAVEIVNTWQNEGHDIYLCSYVRKGRYDFIKSIIDFYGMKYTDILCRSKGEQYREIVEQLKPDILIEDDCKSIGGQKEWCITNVKKELKSKIQSVIVPEFKGIDDIRIEKKGV